jgi:hypothetical protein
MDFAGLRVPDNSLIVRGIAQGGVSGTKTVTVKFDGNDTTCLALRDITTAAGDIVIGLRLPGQIIIIGRLFASAPSAPDEGSVIPPIEGYSRTGTTVFQPVETRSYRSSGWRSDTDDLLQSDWGGDDYIGAAFYAGAMRSLAGATVTRVTIKLKRVSGGSSGDRAPIFRQVTESTKPSGAPTLTGSTQTGPSLGENETDTFTLPDSWGQALVDGTIGGLGIKDTGGVHVRLAGRSRWSPSMTLSIEWERVS